MNIACKQADKATQLQMYDVLGCTSRTRVTHTWLFMRSGSSSEKRFIVFFTGLTTGSGNGSQSSSSSHQVTFLGLSSSLFGRVLLSGSSNCCLLPQQWVRRGGCVPHHALQTEMVSGCVLCFACPTEDQSSMCNDICS